MKTIAAKRRGFGLRHGTVLKTPWLRCSHEYQADPDDLDDRDQAGLRFLASDGTILTAEEAEETVRWFCGPCCDRLIDAPKPKKTDSLMVAGRKHSEMKRPDVLTNHLGSKANLFEFHRQAVQMGLNEDADQQPSQQKLEATMCTSTELQINFLLGVLFVMIFECSIALVSPLRKLGVAWGVLMPPDMSHYTTLQFMFAAEEFFRRHQRQRFFLARAFSALGDGGTDITTEELEMIGARIVWKGKPRNEFISAAVMDLKLSRDGESPDAQCLKAAYHKVFVEMFTLTTGDNDCFLRSDFHIVCR